MPVIIEILIFLGVVGSVIWAGIKHTAQAVSVGVKEKMKEREERLAHESQKQQNTNNFTTNAMPPQRENFALGDNDNVLPSTYERRIRPDSVNNNKLRPIQVNNRDHHKAVMEGALMHTLTEIYTKEVREHFNRSPLQSTPMDALNFMAMVANITKALKTDEVRADLAGAYGIDTPDYERIVDNVCSGVVSTFAK